jgi:hypothetical protein
MLDVAARNGVHDFDFFPGTWKVAHRRLKRRLAACEEWEEFSGTSIARKLLGGFGNVDENEIRFPDGTYIGVTFRTYDPDTGLWSIWWLDSRNPGHLDPPVVGKFQNGTGVFQCEDNFEGRPILVRYVWSRITPTSCRWEQAFSPDTGKSWETNWVMDFVKVA